MFKSSRDRSVLIVIHGGRIVPNITLNWHFRKEHQLSFVEVFYQVKISLVQRNVLKIGHLSISLLEANIMLLNDDILLDQILDPLIASFAINEHIVHLALQLTI